MLGPHRIGTRNGKTAGPNPPASALRQGCARRAAAILDEWCCASAKDQFEAVAEQIIDGSAGLGVVVLP
jgi:hypothetical protein